MAANHLQMSEETHNPSVVVPRSIMISMLVNGTTGFAMLLAVLFCMGDVEKALASPTGYPFMEIFLQATGSMPASAAMASIITILAICATVGLLAGTSRVFWSFARDRGLPFWRTLSKVSASSTIPFAHYVYLASMYKAPTDSLRSTPVPPSPSGRSPSQPSSPAF